MSNLSEKLLACLLWVLVSAACSVKEDRAECPCRLVLDLSEVDTAAIGEIDLRAMSSDGFLLADRIGADEFDHEYVMEVPRSRLWLNAYYGAEEAEIGRDGLHIPSGCECPPVYMWTSFPDTEREIRKDKVMMRKNHCVMTICVEDVDNFGFGLTVRGNVCGYGRDGRPLPGDFSVSSHPDDEGICRICVPRQTDASLILEIDDGTKVQKSFALGEYVMESGFDWKAPDLGDLTVGLDYSLTKVMFSVQGWDNEYVFYVEL